MYNRSWLLVPGDSEKKLSKALATGADVVVIDLENGVPFESKAMARELGAQWLQVHRTQIIESRRIGRWVRINPLDSRMWRDDLVAVMRSAPDGIILPKANGPQGVQQLAAEIYEQEQLNRLPTGSTRIIPMVSDTAHSALTIGAYLEASLPRLAGLSWGAQNLCAALGATRARDNRGQWTDSFRYVRAQVLLGAHARGILALDTLHLELEDDKGLKAAATASRADGFTGMLGVHPAQISIINAAFAPTEAELALARGVVAAFEGSPEASTMQVDRRLIDQAQLKLARRTLGYDEMRGPETAARGAILRPA